MKSTLKNIVIIQTIITIVIASIFLAIHKESHEKNHTENGLLSPRIYQGILKEENKLLFNFEPLEEAIKNYISKKKGIVAVYLLNARDGSILSINNDLQFEPASFNKLPIAIIILNKIENGDLEIDSLLKIREEDKDSTSGQLYKSVKKEFTVEELIKEMLVNSDNTASRVLSHHITEEDWNKLSHYLDYYQHNQSTEYYSINAESNVRLFSSLYLSTLLKKENSEKILSYLTNTTFDIKKIAGLPEEVRVAHKFANYYGNKEKYFHECGIIYIESSRMIYCVMTQGFSGLEAEQIIGTIVHSIYEYVIKSKAQLEKDQLL